MPGSRPRIIVADCDRFIRESLCLGLGSEYDTVQVSSGSEALNAFKAAHTDAVILDLADGVIDAIEICGALRCLKDGEVVPIYIVGDDDDGDAACDAFNAGASDYLIRPVHLGLLSKRIGRDMRIAARVTLSDSSTVEKAQVESELFRQLPEPAVLLGAHGIIMMVNEAFERVFDTKIAVVGRMSTDLLKDFDLTQALNEQMVYTDLSCKARGPVAVRVSCVKIVKGPWKDCIVAFISEHLSAEVVPPVAVVSGLRANILVLEDYDVVARSIRRLLERAGHGVSVASSSDEACKLVSQVVGANRTFDLAILDVSIPGSAGGSDVLKSLRGMIPNLPAIVTSGAWHDPTMSRPADFGFDAVLRKPFSRDELLDVVNKVLGKHSS
jgi:DNA-binding response OmpR family regulator